MLRTRMSLQELGRQGNDLYEREIRQRVEIPENIGKLVSIDVHSGDFEVGEDVLDMTDRLQSRHTNAEIWTKRIGFNAVYAIGGTLSRTAP